jgi:apolipoprotein N-acyltransferase
VLPAILAVIGAWIGFANPLYHFPPLALLFPAALGHAALGADNAGGAFKRCWLMGAAAYAACLYWVAIPGHDFGGLPWVLAAPCPVLLGLYLGLYPGFFGLGLRLCRGLPPILLGLFAACLWASLEMLRGTLLTGFPWLVLASAFSAWPQVLQPASLMGAYALSGLLAGASLMVLGPVKGFPARLAGVLALAGLAAFGVHSLSASTPSSGSLSVSLIQGNIDQSLKWDKAFQNGTVERYITLSGSEVREHAPEMVIWPETALPFYFQEPNVLSGKVRQFARENRVFLLTGSPAYTPDFEKDVMRLHNRAYLIGPGGSNRGTYDKVHLVPFGEYVPLKRLLFFVDKMVDAVGDFVPGKKPGPLDGEGFSPGLLICYETIFPELAQSRVAQGSDLLVNISNDAWFGRSSAPLQHLHLSVLRCVEQRRSMARATNTGISALIDPKGRILARTELFELASLHAPALPLVERKTFFHQNRRLVTGLYIGACAAFLLFCILFRPSPKRGRGMLRA